MAVRDDITACSLLSFTSTRLLLSNIMDANHLSYQTHNHRRYKTIVDEESGVGSALQINWYLMLRCSKCVNKTVHTF